MTESRNKQNNLLETFDYFEDGELREDLDEDDDLNENSH